MMAVARTVSASRFSLLFSTAMRRSEAMTPRSDSEDLGIEDQPLHAVGVELDHLFQGGRRVPVGVAGQVLAGEGVVGAAVGLHDAVELPGPRLCVPLNIMCSMKWDTPVSPGRSLREPTRKNV